jgi:hypothetical protein
VTANLEIFWIDHEREPKSPADPAYPKGIDIDLTRGRLEFCETNLPYPAPRCGMFSIKCRTCGFSTLITTAGRPDDPRSIKLPCDKIEKLNNKFMRSNN